METEGNTIITQVSEKQQRLAWLDIAKGLAILLVILGHNNYVMYPPGKAFNVILSFHIPLFFFLSGYLQDPRIPFRRLLGRRFNSLIKPYLLIALFALPVYALVGYHTTFAATAFWLLYGNGPNLPRHLLHLWFLPHLFMVHIFVWFVYRSAAEFPAWLRILLFALMPITGFLLLSNFCSPEVLNYNPFLLGKTSLVSKGLPWSLDIILVTSFFFISGTLMREFELRYILIKLPIAILALVLFILLHSLFDFSIDLNLRRYDNLFVCTLMAFSGIFVTLYLSKRISRWGNTFSECLMLIGRNSLILYILHPMIQSRTYLFLSSSVNVPVVLCLLSFLVALTVPLILKYMVVQRFTSSSNPSNI